MGNGIFMSDDEDREAQHKLLKGLFSVTAIETTLPIIEDELSKLIAKWTKEITHHPNIDIEEEILLMMLRIMLRTQVSNELTFYYKEIFNALYWHESNLSPPIAKSTTRPNVALCTLKAQ